MKILLTGSNGFVGKNIKSILCERFEIRTLDVCSGVDYQVDLTKEVELITEKFDIVVHTAGLAHSNDIDSKSFFEINFEGTKRLCNSLDENPPKNFVFISSVAVYVYILAENDTLLQLKMTQSNHR